jgi:hypothetical protein
MSSLGSRGRSLAAPRSADVTTYIDRLAAEITDRGGGITAADVSKAYKDLGTIPKSTIRVWKSSIEETIANSDVTGLVRASGFSYSSSNLFAARNDGDDGPNAAPQHAK